MYERNQEIGEWTLLAYEPSVSVKRKVLRKQRWLCLCSCGTLRWVQNDNLANGSSRSCGHDAKGNKFRHKNVVPINSVFGLAAHAGLSQQPRTERT